MSDPSNPVVLKSCYASPLERNKRAIKLFGLRIDSHLQKMGFTKSNIQQTKPEKWKAVQLIVSLYLCQYKIISY